MPHTHTHTHVYIFIYYIAVINTVEKFTAKQNFHQLSAAAYAVDSARSSLGAFVCRVSISVNYSACTVRQGRGGEGKPSHIWP